MVPEVKPFPRPFQHARTGNYLAYLSAGHKLLLRFLVSAVFWIFPPKGERVVVLRIKRDVGAMAG